MKTQVGRLREQEIQSLTVRDGVVGRIVKRKVGTIDLRIWRKHALFVLGWLWHLLATTSIALLTLIVVFTPGSVILKSFSLVALIAFYLFCMGFMNAITLRAVIAWPVFQRHASDTERLRGIRLRIVK